MKLYMIKIFQMYANKRDPLLDCIAEPDEGHQTSCPELLHKKLRASFSHYCTTRLRSHNYNLDQIINTFESSPYSARLNISCPPLPTLIYP